MTDYNLSASYWSRQSASPCTSMAVAPFLCEDDPYCDVLSAPDDDLITCSNACNGVLYAVLTRAVNVTTFIFGAGTIRM